MVSLADQNRLRPRGAKNCLAGMQIIRTGALLSMTDAQLTQYLNAYGATEGKSVTRSTTYLIQGTAPGNAKLAAAAKNGVPILTEDQFFDLIAEKSRELGVEPEMVTFAESLVPAQPGDAKIAPKAPQPSEAPKQAVGQAQQVSAVRLVQLPMEKDDPRASKLGGAPFGGKPEGEHLHLLCQLSLAELPACLLPKKGLLQVFCAPTRMLGPRQSQGPDGLFLVRYLAGTEAPGQASAEPANTPGFFLNGNATNPVRLAASPMTETVCAGQGFGGIKVGGVARSTAGRVESNGDALVLQLDSEGPLTIGDEGLLQVFCPEEEAKEGRFQNAWLRFDRE